MNTTSTESTIIEDLAVRLATKAGVEVLVSHDTWVEFARPTHGGCCPDDPTQTTGPAWDWVDYVSDRHSGLMIKGGWGGGQCGGCGGLGRGWVSTGAHDLAEDMTVELTAAELAEATDSTPEDWALNPDDSVTIFADGVANATTTVADDPYGMVICDLAAGNNDMRDRLRQVAADISREAVETGLTAMLAELEESWQEVVDGAAAKIEETLREELALAVIDVAAWGARNLDAEEVDLDEAHDEGDRCWPLGSETEPGVWHNGHNLEAWDYDPRSKGDCIVVTEDDLP